jgi:tetratricopeptide (TPR) repeat protein
MNPFEFEDEHHEDIRELVERYEDAVRNNTSCFMDQETYEALIEFYEFRNQFNKALSAADQALEHHPFSSILLLKKAQILFELKQCKEALDELDKAELCDISETGIFLLRAEILTFLSRYEEAIQILEALIKSANEEDLPDIYLQMADVYEDWEKYYEVFDCLKCCLRADPENEEALNRINYCMEITEKYQESRTFHENLINEKPYSEFAWYNLSCALKGLGLFDEAIDALEYVLAINEDLNFAYQDIAELHLRKKDYAKALEVLQDYEQKFAADEDIYYLKGQCHEAMQEHKMARYFYKKALHANPVYADAYFRIGDTYKAEDNWKQAYTYFCKASELERQEYDYLLAASEAAHVLQKPEDAIELAELAVDNAPTRFEAYILMANIFVHVGDAVTALEILEKGSVFCKSTVELKFGRIGVLYLMGHKKEAIIQLISMMEEAPGKEIFMLYMNPDIENDPEVASILQSNS